MILIFRRKVPFICSLVVLRRHTRSRCFVIFVFMFQFKQTFFFLLLYQLKHTCVSCNNVSQATSGQMCKDHNKSFINEAHEWCLQYKKFNYSEKEKLLSYVMKVSTSLYRWRMVRWDEKLYFITASIMTCHRFHSVLD